MNNRHVFTAESSDFSMVTKHCMSLTDDNTNILYMQLSLSHALFTQKCEKYVISGSMA